jgi:hypothetical protein
MNRDVSTCTIMLICWSILWGVYEWILLGSWLSGLIFSHIEYPSSDVLYYGVISAVSYKKDTRTYTYRNTTTWIPSVLTHALFIFFILHKWEATQPTFITSITDSCHYALRLYLLCRQIKNHGPMRTAYSIIHLALGRSSLIEIVVCVLLQQGDKLNVLYVANKATNQHMFTGFWGACAP